MTVRYFGKNPEQISNSQCSNNSNRLLRLPQIIGQLEVTPQQAEVNRQSGKSPQTPKTKIEPLIPISRASWWAGVKSGKYPRPIKLGCRTTVWRESEIAEFINSYGEKMHKGGIE